MPEQTEYLSPRQVSQLTGIEAGTLANWRWSGRGPDFVRLGRSIRYPKQDLQHWIEAQRQKPLR